ncbi:zinc ribbon domain-containing protein [Maliponia aquimaris]|uniref:zinc ribbon domain-containing protein n=1 Tax=Maliponia aquimaris TaxID=1673631 RepID=UPI000B8AEF82|nr:zinc ribbon domain-containing protein [Maliponia aquimaris]
MKARQKSTRNSAISGGLAKAKRASHLFSGLLTCGCCGGGYILVGKAYYGCANSRNKGTCDNRLTIRKEGLERRVLSGLKDELLHPDLIAEFVKAYQEEYNRLSKESLRERDAAAKELVGVVRQIDRIVDAIAEGMFHPSMKSKMDGLEARKAELEAQLAAEPDKTPVLLHPGLADRYRAEVASLNAALDNPATKAEATLIIRSLLSEIRLIPDDESLALELVGELAGLLSLNKAETTNPRGGKPAGRSTSLVAGVGFEPTTFRL